VSAAAAGDARFTALVLAGSRGPDDPVASAAGVAHKCLAPVAGVPMLVRVVETLTACSPVDRIAVMLEDPTLADQLPALRPLIAAGRCTLLRTAATPSLSVQRALDELPDPLPLLVTTGDHPLLTPEIVEYFCAAARQSGADLAAGLTPAAAIRKAYPDAQRTYLRFRDERYSGANLFAVLKPQGRRAIAFWRRVEQERKRPWRLVRAFGWRSLVAYLLGRLSLDDAMTRASRVIGARVVAVVMPQAEAAIDVDKPSDLELVETILAGRRQRITLDRGESGREKTPWPGRPKRRC
jgi:GTP:adenosylcobinamide-phosphate guanylyltransferase